MPAVFFRQPRTRHPLARVLSAVAGLLVLGATLMFGFFIIVALVVVGAIVWGVRQFAKSGTDQAHPSGQREDARAAPPGVIEGEYVVVREPVSPQR